MKIFLDSVDVTAVKKWTDYGLIDGVTTNPGLLSKATGNPIDAIKEIIALMPQGDISVEITETDAQKAYKQAHEIARLGDNVVVKIPCHIDYYDLIRSLVKEGIPLNITLVFSLAQGVMMSKMGVTYISPFVGRLEDNNLNGIFLLHQLHHVIKQYRWKTQILAASLRTVDLVNDAWMNSVDAITISPSIMEQLTTHELTNEGIARFKQEWEKKGITQFP